MRTKHVGSLFAICVFVAACSPSLDGGTRNGAFVRQALAPESADAACNFRPDPSAPPLSRGRLDVGITTAYMLTLLVQSTIGGSGTQITNAHLTFHTSATGPQLDERDVPVNGFVEPNGLGVVDVLAAVDSTWPLPEFLSNRNAVMSIVVDITLSGHDAVSGAPVGAPTFSFPFDACNGCLVTFGPESQDPATLQYPNCHAPASPDLKLPCRPGQERPLSCQLCQGMDACDPTKLR
jgi:hypothetical protein